MADHFCRCLLRDLDAEKPMAQTIQEYVASLPEDLRADSGNYNARLEFCKNCAHLRNGTCGLCGCYVEARAAKKSIHCPDVPAKW